MRKSLLLLLALTTGWLTAFSNNYVLNAGSSTAKFEQTQSYAFSLLAESSVFGQYLTKQLFVANSVTNCDGLRVFSVNGNCEADNINWNIPISGDGESLLVGYPRVFNTTTNTVEAGVNPTTQPITLPAGEYEIQYLYNGDDFCNIPIRVVDDVDPVFTAATGCAATYAFGTDGDTCIATIPANTIAIPMGTDNCVGAKVIWSVTDLFDGVITDSVLANVGGFLPDSIELGTGTTTVNFTLVDAARASISCSATITVTDANAPVFVDNNGVEINPAVDYPDVVGINAIDNDQGECSGTAAFDLPLAYDTCAGSLPITFYIIENFPADTVATGSGDINDFSFSAGLSTVSVTATDGVMAPISFSFQVEVIDDEDPVILGCIEDFEYEFATSNNGLNDCTAEVVFPDILASDNCDEASNLIVEWFILDKAGLNVVDAGNATGNSFPIVYDLEPDTFIVTYTVEDNNGNVSNACQGLFVVKDDEAPARIGGAPSQDQNLLVGASCDVDATIAVPNVGDNSTGCSGTGIQSGFFQYITITNTNTGLVVKQDTVSNALINVTETFGIGSYSVTWNAEDYSGNKTEIEQFNINVSDDIDPTISVNANYSINLSARTGAPAYDGCTFTETIPAITFNDNCAVDTVYVSNGTYNAATRTVTATLSIGTNTFVYTAKDEAGNDVTGTTVVTVVDDVNPTLNGNFSYPNIIEPVAAGQCSFSKSWNVLSFFNPADQCADNLDSLYIIFDENNDGIAVGDTVLGDEVANIGASQKVNFVFEGPANTHAIIVKAIDEAGNSVQKSFTVTANDEQAPELFYQDTLTVFVNSNDCQSAYAEIAFDGQLVSDNCTDTTALLANMTNNVSGNGTTVAGFFNIGAPGPYHSVVFTTEDAVGNSASKTVVIHVVDTLLPGIDLTPIDTIANDQRVCTGRTKVFAPVATDACGITSVKYSINGSDFADLPSGETEFPYTFPVGTNAIVWQVIDNNGNTSLDSQFVTVEDVEAPVIELIQDFDLETTAGNCEQSLTIPFPVVTDNCNDLDSAYITVDDNNGNIVIGANSADLIVSIEPGTNYTGKVYAVDNNGNRDSISFDINLEDVIAPTISCPGSIDLGVNSENCSADTVLMKTFGFNPADNCTNVTLTAVANGNQNFDPNASFSFPVGTTSVQLYISDDNGNIDSCIFDVNVTNDISSHILDFPTDTVVNVTPNECSRRHFWNEPRIVGNNCNGETINYTRDFNPGQDFPIGTTTVTYTFTRSNGTGVIQTETRSFNITVVDNQKPVITQAPSDKTLRVGEGCVARLEYPDINFQDNCDAQGITIETTPGLTSGSDLTVGNYVVTIKVIDMSGNADSTSFNVTVIDDVAPVIALNNGVSSPVEVCGTNTNLNTLVSATDVCGIAGNITFSPATLAPGTNNVTATATDNNGNVGTFDFVVNAYEAITPQITSAPATAFCAGAASTYTADAIPASATGVWSTNGASTISNPNATTTDITFNNPGIYNVTWTVTNGVCNAVSTTQTTTIYNNVVASITQDTINIFDTDEVTLRGSNVGGNLGLWSTTNGAVTIDDAIAPTTNASGITTNTTFTWSISIPGCGTTSDNVVVVPLKSNQIIENLEDAVQSGFTPGASSNTTWDLSEIINDGNYNNGVVYVYNRWGNLVYESAISNYVGNEWDGTFEGNELPTASYYFVIDPKQDGVRVITGDVTIIR